MNITRLLALGLLALASAASTTYAEPPPANAAPATAPAAAKAETLTVAILDFDAGTGEIGKQIAEALTALLSQTKGIQLVDRAAMHKTLAEHELNLTGLVDADKALTIGKLVGAKILVTGKVFTLGKASYVTAKMIGTETSLVEGVLVKGKEDDDTGALVTALADKLATQLVESGPKLVKTTDGGDGTFAALKAQLAKLKLPVVSVSIREEHHGAARRPIDPAVENEIKSMLQDCGFTVADPERLPAGGVDYLITGEAFSEFAARVGNLISCAGRAELSVTSRADSKIVVSGRTTARAVDLAENIAGKTALQKAGHTLGLKVLDYFAKNLPPAKP